MNSTPQPFVNIYIAATPDLAAQDKATTNLCLKADTGTSSENTDTQLSSLTLNDSSTPKFLIHVISHHSCFFAAFNGNFIEGTTQAMALDVDEKAFGVIANWFYNRAVVSEVGDRPSVVILAKVWILAERLLMPRLQNRAMDAICASHGPFPLPEFAEFAQMGPTMALARIL
jgi:hypothetical protein